MVEKKVWAGKLIIKNYCNISKISIRSNKFFILARGPRTAREIRQFAGSNFRDFVRLENVIKFDEDKYKK